MNKLSLIILTALLAINCHSQERSQIFVIGNIHDSVPNYHPTILYSILQDVKPDIILHEVDSKGMADYEKMMDMDENEIIASTKYKKTHPGTLRFGFDFEGRNQYRRNHGMVPTDNLTVKLIDSLYKANKLSESQSKIYKEFLGITNQLVNVATKDPREFNNAENDLLCKKRQDCQYKELRKISDERPEFAKRYVVKPDGKKISYREGFALMAEFWNLRNKTMANNIYKIAKENPGKRIVVLTGFLHRYYIIDELKKINDINYSVKEFYSN